jgi:PiT family inorganic phosphate transporter
MAWVVLGVVTLLAWSNGSNDNFKGVAALYGAGGASYKSALIVATVAQLAGSLLTLLLAAGLVTRFSAQGLVPDAVAASHVFLTAAALGAGLTVLLATFFGLPVSTTHGLTGALIGAGLATGAGVNFAVLGKSFVLPLLLSPALALAITAVLYPAAHRLRARLGIARESCVCLEKEYVPLRLALAAGPEAAAKVQLAVTTGTSCERYGGVVVGLSAQRLLDALQFVSAGAVCFARALNDTPKIVALLIAAKALSPGTGLPIIGAAMAVGGLIGARRVAETMARRITPLNAGQGFVASLTTAALVIAASWFGLPVSTTHVSTGAIFGIGAVTRRARPKTVVAILTAWLTTLPLGAALGAASLLALRAMDSSTPIDGGPIQAGRSPHGETAVRAGDGRRDAGPRSRERAEDFQHPIPVLGDGRPDVLDRQAAEQRGAGDQRRLDVHGQRDHRRRR